MKFLEKLFSPNQGSKLHPTLEQSEREAIIDLLLLGIYIDDHLSLTETDNFDESTDALGWESTTPLSVYLSNATDRARTARIEEQLIDDYISFAAERLGSKGSKERALELLNRLLTSDGKTEKETDYFNKVSGSLND